MFRNEKNLKIPYLLIGGRLSIHFLKLFSQAMAMAIHNGKGEYFRDTILDALLFEGETILEC